MTGTACGHLRLRKCPVKCGCVIKKGLFLSLTYPEHATHRILRLPVLTAGLRAPSDIALRFEHELEARWRRFGMAPATEDRNTLIMMCLGSCSLA
jgi:hypothetical protein